MNSFDINELESWLSSQPTFFEQEQTKNKLCLQAEGSSLQLETQLEIEGATAPADKESI